METTLKVKLISHTLNPELVIATAGKLCYSPSNIDDLMEKQTDESIERFVNMITSIGHGSVLEHTSFTFGIEGVSRSLTHQLVRHRIASYSQQSQRYVKLDETFEHTTPNVVKEMGMADEWHEDMLEILDKYIKWQRLIKDYVEENDYPTNGMNAEKVANENARGMLPNACETKMVMTMNARELLHFFNKRCCHRAQEPICELANEMLKLCKEVAPTLFKYAGADCVRGRCKEGNMTCGNPYPKEK